MKTLKTFNSRILTGINEWTCRTNGVTAGKVVKELERIAFADTEITGKEKMKALELLGKHLGMFQSGGSDDSKVLEKLDEVPGGIKNEF